MNLNGKIVVTGALGFIGSYFVSFLNRKGYKNIILVDDFSLNQNNIEGKEYISKINFTDFFNHNLNVNYVFHFGACSDTMELNYNIHKRLNLDYSKKIWDFCIDKNVPLIYASSAATYGNGKYGYDDNHDIIGKLLPLNPYGISKNEFDLWAINQEKAPPFWTGLKFFNVYGPNEYHKGKMSSVILHAYKQIKETGAVKLFKSHNSYFNNGEQTRDFIHVHDISNICYWFMSHQLNSGVYNAGTGEPRTFLDIADIIFQKLSKNSIIEFIDTPISIRENYQYYTKANIKKLRKIGYKRSFYTLEEGIEDYINYLENNSYY